MTRGVTLVSLSVKDVGPITGRIDLGPFSHGVNVISGRNEIGKSTLVAALRAALFERHDAKHTGIKTLQTHGTRNAPEVWVELDIGGERVSVHKRFLEKPVVELRLPGGGAPHQGHEAEDLLLARLEGRRAGRTGGTKNDMGLWGLLWVTQDDTAYADPGQSLDEGVRGALSDAVGRHVGQILGGRRSELVRTRVVENANRFFSHRGSTKAGEYREAEERLAAAKERVSKIAQAVAEVEDLAARHAASTAQLSEQERHLPRLEAEQTAAIDDERRSKELDEIAEKAAARLATAEAELAAVNKDMTARALLTTELARLAAEITRRDGAIIELEQTLDDLARVATDAREQAHAARATAIAARANLDAKSKSLERARRREESARVRGALARAEEVVVELEAASKLTREGIGEETFAQIEGLAAKAVEMRARLDAEGTRIVVHRAAGDPLVVSVARSSTIELPELGVLEIEPARPGLARAVIEAGRSRAKLEEALLALGVADVQAAKERYAARAESEGERAALDARRRALAPEGLDVLEQRVLAAQAERARLETALDGATAADLEREESEGALASNRVGEEAIDGLRRAEHEVAVLHAASEAMGTHVEIHALADLRLRANGAAVEDLPTGHRRPLALTQASTIVLEGVAELRFEPRGEDLAKSRAKLARAQNEFASSLDALGVGSLDEATRAARAWATLDEARRRAEERLAVTAPRGLNELRADVAKVRDRSRALENAFADARRLLARREQIEVDLAQERVAEDGLARLEALGRELRDQESEIDQLQARVRAVSGPVAEGAPRAWFVSETLRPEAVVGVVWEIVPGELGEGIDVEGIEQRLLGALVSAGVTTLASARERYVAGLELRGGAGSLERELRGLAPDGLDALRARAAALDARGPNGAEGDEAYSTSGVPDLEVAVREQNDHALAAHTTADKATDAADVAARAHDAHHGSLRESRGERHTMNDHRETVAASLAAVRRGESDAALVDRRAASLAARDLAREAARIAAANVAEATPRLLAGEVARAAGAIASWKLSVRSLRDEALRLKTLLAKAAVEGHFEELEDAQAEQSDAIAAVERIEREASAARLLATVVEEAYDESQRIFLAPVLKEAAPYLARLRPGTEIRMTRDLTLEKVVRRGTEEDFGQLSGGTREQLSVIVRLALARVMARDERPLPLILDDTMGWTDDGRFLSMVQILRDAAHELQIILLTCHPSRFDRFQADYSVDLDGLVVVQAGETRILR